MQQALKNAQAAQAAQAGTAESNEVVEEENGMVTYKGELMTKKSSTAAVLQKPAVVMRKNTGKNTKK